MFQNNFILHALVAIKPLVLLIGCLVADSARTAAGRQTDTHTHTDKVQYNYTLTVQAQSLPDNTQSNMLQ